jgi:hypothetical protein
MGQRWGPSHPRGSPGAPREERLPAVHRAITIATDDPRVIATLAAPAAGSVEDELAAFAKALPSAIDRPRTPAFDRELALVRLHLRVIHSRATLAASFGRESFWRVGAARPAAGPDRLVASAVAMAYAIRWAELGGDGGPA